MQNLNMDITIFFLIAITMIASMPLVIWILTTLALFIAEIIDTVRENHEKRGRASDKESDSDTQD